MAKAWMGIVFSSRQRRAAEVLCERLLLPAGQAEAPALAATQRPAAVAPEQRRSAASDLEGPVQMPSGI